MTNTPRRRSPAPEERRIDADRSRRLLLDAALEEFAGKGFAGARVRDIAARAGVSKDLVNYHFGGKEGLYAEVQRAWLRREDAFSDPRLPLAENLIRYLHDALDDPRPMRLLAWRGLTGVDEPPPDLTDGADDLAGMRRRQRRGELAADLDPATVRLVLLGALAAPVVFPHVARRLFGIEPGAPEFEARYGEGLRRLLDHLAPASPAADGPAPDDE
ncbi:TetR/AcrR family transcriptional regulator [Actinoallomurus sp. NBC_01490]|uniref:TetR/AcrR family transcriptional regulator n=1 Tax=Actinoallomurus sp. NBC_01490 TaxID=2903557 RepID=UPI002E30D49B|nr:helix-turn-helix domain-containing protein [Actinoallomurus sp. NBC_01490]